MKNLLNKFFGVKAAEKTAQDIASPLTSMLSDAKESSAAITTTITEMEDKVEKLKEQVGEIDKLVDWLETGVPVQK